MKVREVSAEFIRMIFWHEAELRQQSFWDFLTELSSSGDMWDTQPDLAFQFWRGGDLIQEDRHSAITVVVAEPTEFTSWLYMVTTVSAFLNSKIVTARSCFDYVRTVRFAL